MTFRDISDLSVDTNALRSVRSPGSGSYYKDGLKRVLDVAFVIATLPISVPLLLIMVTLVALQGGKPIYLQRRVGKGGKIFNMVKVRTMVRDADALLEGYLRTHPDERAEWDATQKLKCDPRITRLGRFLRKSSMDELPQLWNVLVGDMSLVGPRPMMTCQREMYPGKAYFELRPGITGLWQVSDRNEASFAERAVFDETYLATLSAQNDLAILLKTVTVVFRGTGY